MQSSRFIISYINEVIETLSTSGDSRWFYTARTERTWLVECMAPTNSMRNVQVVKPRDLLLHARVYGSYKYNKSSFWFWMLIPPRCGRATHGAPCWRYLNIWYDLCTCVKYNQSRIGSMGIPRRQLATGPHFSHKIGHTEHWHSGVIRDAEELMDNHCTCAWHLMCYSHFEYLFYVRFECNAMTLTWYIWQIQAPPRACQLWEASNKALGRWWPRPLQAH